MNPDRILPFIAFDIPLPARLAVHHEGQSVAAIGAMCLRTPYWFVPTDDYGIDDLADEYAELIVAMLRSDTIAPPAR